MIDYVVYTHTDYLDVLTIQTDYLSNYQDTILLINKTDLNLDNMYSKYKQVLFYDDSLPYASRLLELSKLNVKYILLIHDIDIVIEKDDSFIEGLVEIMKEKNLDRIDLQYQDPSCNPDTEQIPAGPNYLHKQENIDAYIYNVNPSIWKISSLMDLMNTFKNETYRTIERTETQKYATKFKIYKLIPTSGEPIQCGYYKCTKEFQFLHITHGGAFLPVDGPLCQESTKFIWDMIVKTYLQNTNRPFWPAGRPRG